MKHLFPALIVALASLWLASCSDKESYADLLTDESHAVNYYLTQYQVVNDVPADTVFTSVNDLVADGMAYEDALKLAPYYRIDPDGQLYMQVVDPGTKGLKAKADQLINFRFTRYNLNFYYKYGDWNAEGNDSNMGTASTSFRYGNFTLTSSAQWGTGIQTPLSYLSADCSVRIIIKSALGPVDEVSSVYGYVYYVRYFVPKV